MAQTDVTTTAAEAANIKKEMSEERMSSVVRVIILIWSGGLLTMYYLGGLGRLDTTFIGGLLTQTLAGFGVTFASKKKEEMSPELNSQQPKKAPTIK